MTRLRDVLAYTAPVLFGVVSHLYALTGWRPSLAGPDGEPERAALPPHLPHAATGQIGA